MAEVPSLPGHSLSAQHYGEEHKPGLEGGQCVGHPPKQPRLWVPSHRASCPQSSGGSNSLG